jgi:RNA polymerase sigma factor (sigma-70 family)
MPLSDAALRQLCTRARQGSAAARDRILHAHWGMIVHVAAYFHRAGAFLEMGDLIQQGGLGLLHAIEKYDPRRRSRGVPVRFATYAHYWVMHAIRREIENHGRTVAVPIKRLRARKGSVPQDIPLQEDMTSLSLADPRDTSEQWCREWEARLEVDQLLARLSERTRWILRYRYGLVSGLDPLTQTDVGKKLRISGARVGMQERAALHELRRAVQSAP